MTLRVLTVRQPWAWSLIEGGKDVENRSRNIAGSYRGPVAIHAGLARFEDDGLWSVRKAIKSLDLGYEASDSQVGQRIMLSPRIRGSYMALLSGWLILYRFTGHGRVGSMVSAAFLMS
jgi:hypothetical protein